MQLLDRRRTLLLLIAALALVALLPLATRSHEEPAAAITPAQLVIPGLDVAQLQWYVVRGGVPATSTPIAAPLREPRVRTSLVPQDRVRRGERVFRSRPEGYDPAAIVIHATGSGAPGSAFRSVGELGRFFSRPAARAASHYGVGRGGEILRYVDDDDAAFHVATRGWNDISIGIELLNDNTGTQPFTAAQLAATSHLVRSLAVRHRIPLEGVVRHRDVQPTDRSDPARNFPWTAWRRALAQPASN
ncbi:MAG: N-acetylmuramoyl-L-alanine amidase [Thermoleophilia bacterium]|nr:N-acetylmuramoyl-L-alanine amidase [Thermoleophilia bacterium]